MTEQEIKQKAVQLLGALTNAYGAPGDEAEIRSIIRSELGDGVRADRTGNLVCSIDGQARRPRIMLTAHMDEVGFVVQSIGRSGLIKFHSLE